MSCRRCSAPLRLAGPAPTKRTSTSRVSRSRSAIQSPVTGESGDVRQSGRSITTFAVDHRLAGQPVRLQNARLLQLLAFGPADGRQLLPAAENLHAAGGAGADAAARMHQFHTACSSSGQQAGARFDLHADLIR